MSKSIGSRELEEDDKVEKNHICGGSQTSNLIKEVVQNISNELETMCDSPG